VARLLITGATGFLGSCVAREALDEHEVFGLSRRTIPSSARWHHWCLDLTDASSALLFLRRLRPKIIIHCAALTDVEQCERDESHARAVNVDSTKTLSTWASENGAKLVLISTDSVFDGVCGNYRESDEPAPVNVYARTKLAAEEAVRLCCPEALIIRTNFFGWSHARNAGLAEWMLAKLIRRESFGGFTDVRFNPLFTGDLAHIILELIRREARGIFHIGARDSYSKYEFSIELARVFHLDASIVHPIPVDEFPFRARRPKDTSLATEKVSEFLGREMPSVSEQVQMMRKTMPLGEYRAGDSGRETLIRSSAVM
jgi:dTDP-4-dehydrorhamnose reductase